MKQLTATLFIIFLLANGVIAQGLFESALQLSPDTAAMAGFLHGQIKSVSYTGFNTEKNQPTLQAIYGQLDLELDVPAGKYGKAFADFRVRQGSEYGRPLSELTLREAWVEIYLGGIQVRTGKQFQTWGVSGFLNPSDRFSPENPVLRSPDQNDLRLGTWSLKADVMISNASSLEFTWLPDYSPSVLLTTPFDLPSYIQIPSWPERQITFSETGFGFRYDLRSSLLDLQLSFYHGFRDSPALAVDTAVFDPTTFAPELLLMRQEPVRINSAGLNVTVPAGSALIRSEIGWTDPVKNSVPGSSLPELAFTLEIEQSGENVSVIAGYYGKYLHDFNAAGVDLTLFSGQLPEMTDLFPPGTTPGMEALQNYLHNQITGFNRLYEYQQEKFMHAVYTIADLTMFHNLVNIQFPGMYNFTTGELTLMPSLEFSITDGLSAKMGAYFLHGDKDSLYGLIGSSLNAGFLVIEMKF